MVDQRKIVLAVPAAANAPIGAAFWRSRRPRNMVLPVPEYPAPEHPGPEELPRPRPHMPPHSTRNVLRRPLLPDTAGKTAIGIGMAKGA